MEKRKRKSAKHQKVAHRIQPSRSRTLARKGIRTGADFAGVMSALMVDLLDGKVTPQVGNATCNASGKLLKIVEMQHKYGQQVSKKNQPHLELTS